MCNNKQKYKLDFDLWIILLIIIGIVLYGIFVVVPNEEKIAKCVLENKDQLNVKDVCKAKLLNKQL